MEKGFVSIAHSFNIKGNIKSIESYGCGHINDTYLIITDTNKYILQRINDKVFSNVDLLMNNIKLVTEFMGCKIEERGGDRYNEALTLVPTNNGMPYLKSCTGNYRLYYFIDNCISYNRVEKIADFRAAADAFGKFAYYMAQFDAKLLHESIKDFHNTPVRFNNFLKSVEEDKMGRVKSVQEEIDFVLIRENYCDRVTTLLNSGKLPLKVIHNDTKLNNVLIDKDLGVAKAVIDLDTVMPGTILYDFGDAIRFGCNPASEDEKDLSKVNFRVDLFEAFLKSYLNALGDSVTDLERKMLPFSAILLTYECGMRFLTDYLQGDIYFKVHHEGHNLDRARTQFKLIKDMENMLPLLEKFCI